MLNILKSFDMQIIEYWIWYNNNLYWETNLKSFLDILELNKDYKISKLYYYTDYNERKQFSPFILHLLNKLTNCKTVLLIEDKILTLNFDVY